ncbi:MAG: hypothetical protein JOY83_10930, partial [Alphaproteobacteria bacterium]|nr:hypothetical protein [Alphaproteobacteria bacterium]
MLGFDHKTLATTPEENAEALLSELKGLGAEPGTQLDAVAFSRGGLVLRYLTECLLPREGWLLAPNRLVFVGCTNGGTGLAAPENWRRLVDLYTNITLAGTKALGLVPGLGTFSAVLGQTIESLGRFAQYMAEAAIDDGEVPGLAAMQPHSPLVRALNDADPLPGPNSQYFAVIGDFEPSEPAPGFTEALRDFVLNRVTDRLMGGKNDLVVNTDAMTIFGRHQVWLEPSNIISAAGNVYHTVYFRGSVLPETLTGWLFGDAGLLPDITPLDDYDAPAEPPSRSDDVDWLVRGAGRARRAPPAPAPPPPPPPGAASTPAPPPRSRGISVGSPSPMRFVPAAPSPPRFAPDIPDAAALEEKPRPAWRRLFDRVLESLSAPASVTLSAPPAQFEFAPAPASASAPAQSTEASEKELAPVTPFTCHFDAEIASRPPLEEPTALTVLLSREQPQAEQTPTHRTASAATIEAEPIDVRARPIRNCAIEGEANRTVSPPEPQHPLKVTFKVRGLAEGEAEVWVEARQEDRKLVTLCLAPVFVASSAKLIASAQVPTGEDEGALIDLRIRDVTISDSQPVRLEYAIESDELALLFEEESIEHKGKTRLDFIRSIYQDIANFWRQASRGQPEL